MQHDGNNMWTTTKGQHWQRKVPEEDWILRWGKITLSWSDIMHTTTDRLPWTVPSKSIQVMSNGISKDKNTTVESHRTDTWERQTRGQLPAEDRFYHVCLSLGCRKIEKSESDSCECHSCDRKTSDNNMWDRTKGGALSGAFGSIVQIFSLIVYLIFSLSKVPATQKDRNELMVDNCQAEQVSTWQPRNHEKQT